MLDANLSRAGVPQGQFPNGQIDFDSARIDYADGGKCQLSGTELSLLRYFWENRGRLLSRPQILCSVWGITSANVRTRTIDMHVAHLRRKLREDATRRKVLVSVRGKGYIFAPETCAAAA
jgi:DNA-binding response OmpR family regulator